MSTTRPIIFSLSESEHFARAVADRLDLTLGELKERSFTDGEHKARPLESVRGRDVYVIQSLYADDEHTVNDKLVRYLFFLGAVRDAGAARVTAVAPYLCYARKDRRTKPRDPLNTRYVAAMLESIGIDRIVTLDVHNLAAFQNASRCQTVHLDAIGLFVEHFRPLADQGGIVVASPDAGGVKRAETFRQAIAEATGCETDSAFLEKFRSGGEVSGGAVVGDVAEKIVLIIDDMIASGGTMVRAASAFKDHGAQAVHAAATHGLFVGDAGNTLADDALDSVAVTDTIPPFRLDEKSPAHEKLTTLDASALIADTIDRLHRDQPITPLQTFG